MDEERVQEDSVVQQWKGGNLREFSSARLRSVQPTIVFSSDLSQQEREGKKLTRMKMCNE